MKKQDKLMADLQRLLETQEFQSEEEITKFLDSLVGHKIPSLPEEALTAKEQAQDLVFAAYEQSLAKGRASIEKALKLDPDCIEAYEYLGDSEPVTEIAIAFYERGIAIGRQLFGGKYLKEHKGMFWGFHETRPFMRCLQSYAEVLYDLGKVKECVAVFEEMIALNPNDNQGVRDQLLLYLIQLDEREKFEKYAKKYQKDGLAFSSFNRALFSFKTEGETEASNKKLMEAIHRNKFVALKIVSKKTITDLPEMFGIGDENEAKYYAFYARHIWHQTPGALEWLKKHAHEQ
jgi:tetratricopeptide (TPR) repeat protein